MTATRLPRVPARRLVVAACAAGLVAGAVAAPVAAAQPQAGTPRAKMTLEIGGTQFLDNEKVDAQIFNGQPGCKAAIVLSGNGESGTANVKIGADGTAEAVFESIPAANGTYVLTATVKASSKCKQVSAQDSFRVYDPTVIGPKKVSVGATVTIKASSYPAGATLKWLVYRNGKKWAGGTTKVTSSGTSSLKVSADKSGNYSVKASTGKFVDAWAFAAS